MFLKLRVMSAYGKFGTQKACKETIDQAINNAVFVITVLAS